jgi:hypothetical protein
MNDRDTRLIDAPLVKLIGVIVLEAQLNDVKSILLERVGGHAANVYFDGQFCDTIPQKLYPVITSKIKDLAGMPLSSREPIQEGRLNLINKLGSWDVLYMQSDDWRAVELNRA